MVVEPETSETAVCQPVCVWIGGASPARRSEMDLLKQSEMCDNRSLTTGSRSLEERRSLCNFKWNLSLSVNCKPWRSVKCSRTTGSEPRWGLGTINGAATQLEKLNQ